jgi:hypothetical protein
VQFTNNLIVPVIPEKFTHNRKNEIIDLLIKNGELKSKMDPRIPSLFRPAYFDFKLELSPIIDTINIKNIIYKDFIYNYFKYEFSRILQENTETKSKSQLMKAIEYYSSFLKKQDSSFLKKSRAKNYDESLENNVNNIKDEEKYNELPFINLSERLDSSLLEVIKNMLSSKSLERVDRKTMMLIEKLKDET